MGYPAISTVGRSPLLDGDEAGGIICVHSYCFQSGSHFKVVQVQVVRMVQDALSWQDLAYLTARHDLLELLAANWTTILLGIPAVFLLYGILLAVYRLVFSPLARFPGPKIAAATGWYELYHDVVKPGQYFYRINEFHDKYGMFDGKNHSNAYRD